MDEIQKVLIKQGRKDLAQEYYEKVAGANYSLYQPKTIEEMMKLSKGTQWDIQAEQYAKMYFGKVVFVLENKKPVAAVVTEFGMNKDAIYDRKDARITSGPIFDFVKRKLLVANKVAKKGKLSGADLDKFQTIADDAGGELYRGYSGRGMYGETCIGITGDATNIIEQAGAQGIKGAKTDSMGLSDIVYWPNYPDDQNIASKKAGIRGNDDEGEEEDSEDWLSKNAEKTYGRGAYKITGKFIYASQFKDFESMKKALEGKKYSTISIYSGGGSESVAIVFGTVEKTKDVKFGNGRFTLNSQDAEWSTVAANGCLMHLGNYIIALDDD